MSASIQMFASPSDAKPSAKNPNGFTDLLSAKNADKSASSSDHNGLSFAEELAQADTDVELGGQSQTIRPDDIRTFLSANNIPHENDVLSEIAIKSGDPDTFQTIKLDISDEVPGQAPGVIRPDFETGMISANTDGFLEPSYRDLPEAGMVNLETIVTVNDESVPISSTTLQSEQMGQAIVPLDPAELNLIPSEDHQSGSVLLSSGLIETTEKSDGTVELTVATVRGGGGQAVGSFETDSLEKMTSDGAMGGALISSSQDAELPPVKPSTQTSSPNATAQSLAAPGQTQIQSQLTGQALAPTASFTITAQTEIGVASGNSQLMETDPKFASDQGTARSGIAFSETEALNRVQTSLSGEAAHPRDMDIRLGDKAANALQPLTSFEGGTPAKSLPVSLLTSTPAPAVLPLAGMGEKMAASILQAAQFQAPVTLDKIPQAVVAIALTARSATLQIDPPEMGRIQLDYQFDTQGRTVVTLVPESEAARAALTDRMASILSSLQQSASGEIDVRIGNSSDFTADQNFGDDQEEESGPSRAGDLELADTPARDPLIDLRAFLNPSPGQDGRLHIRV